MPQLPAHLAALVYGLTAALFSLGVFYLVGLLVAPERSQSFLRWPDNIMVGLTLYVILCWIGIASRNIPLKYIPFALAAIIWIPASNRLRAVKGLLATRLRSREARRWILDFSFLYALAYILTPSAGPPFLPLGSGDNLTLVTYARHARELFEFGSTNIDLALFDYMHSPASMYVLAWQSLIFGRDPLQAAMPTLLLLAALFGMIAAETARTAFGLSRNASLAIAFVVVCAPLFRLMLGAYGIAEMLAAIALLYILRSLARGAADRSTVVFAGSCAFAGGVLLISTAPPSAGWGHQMAQGFVALLNTVSFLSWFGMPAAVPAVTELSREARSASVIVLALVPVVLAGIARAARGLRPLDRPGITEIDHRLARALVVYSAVALTLGNVVVYAVNRQRAVRRPAEWRKLDEVNSLSFRTFTLKVSDEPNGLSTALAMYYLPGRKAQVFGRAVAAQDLAFDNVSKEQPLFIQNFGCEGAGHSDTLSVPSVGCLLMAPPSMTLGTSYPFNQTFLFLTFDYMTPREVGGRWNTRPTLQLQVKSDPQRVPLDRELFINLLLHPMTPDATKPRHLVFRWGADHRGETLLAERRWISLPVRKADWKDARLWMLPITIDFLDGRSVLFNEIALTEEPRGAIVGQEQPAEPR